MPYVPAGNEFLVNTATLGDQFEPAVTRLASGRFVVTWQDRSGVGGDTSIYAVKAQLFEADGTKVGGELLVNTETANSQENATITALSSGGFVVSWSDNSGAGGDSSPPSVKARVYDADGNALSGEILINGAVAGGQDQPTITALGTGFVVSWTDRSGELDASAESVKARIFDASGNPLTGDILVNTTVSGPQYTSAVASLSGGGFVVTWTDSSGVGADPDTSVRGQVFDALGNKVGGEFIVNTIVANGQLQPAVTALQSGGFVVAWLDMSATGADSSISAIKAQLFDSAGNKIGGEFLVNTTTAGAQENVALATLDSGEFVATWTDYSLGFGDANVRGQVFTAGGVKVGSEFIVNSTTTGSQAVPTVAPHSGGGFVVSWGDSSGQGGDSSLSSTKARIFAPDTIDGTPGDDSLNGTAASETINGLAGNDTIDGGAGDDTINGGDDNDTINGGAGNDTVNAGAGDDTIIIVGGTNSANTSFETVDGGPGTDHLIVDYSAMTDPVGVYVNDLNSGTGFADVPDGVTRKINFTNIERVTITTGVANDIVNGLNGNDALSTAGGNDLLIAWGGNDTLNGGTGADEMRGGTGDDTYIVDDQGDTIVENANEGKDVVRALASYTLGAGDSIEVLAAFSRSGTAALDLTGNELVQSIYGSQGANVLDGGGSADTMFGFGGNDTYFADNAGDVVVEAAGEGKDVVHASTSYALASGSEIEVLVARFRSSTTAQDLTGNDFAQSIYGSQGPNVIDGLGGADVMFGFGGDDTYFVDNGGDVAVEGADQGRDTVYTSVDHRLGANVETLVARFPAGTDPLKLTGNDLDNAIYGTAGNNRIDGGAGADTMVGFAGDDTYQVDNAGDLVVERADEGHDVVIASADYALASDTRVEVLAAGGSSPIDLTGNQLGQAIYGNSGDNVLSGKEGLDVLYGFGGADSFVFDTNPAGGNYDYIGDFEEGVDKIVLDNMVYQGLPEGPLAPGAFHTGTAAADADDRIIYDAQSGALYYDADGNGVGEKLLFAMVQPGEPLQASDFVVI